MTTDEFSHEVGLVFQEEWKNARRWAVVRSFVWGMIAGATINILARLI
jgi:Sec-independent protein secretion pathway component TatC